jgi:hypothetical protein
MDPPETIAADSITVRWTMEAGDILGGSQLYQRRLWWSLRIAPVVFFGFGGLTFAAGFDPLASLLFVLGGLVLTLALVNTRRRLTTVGRSLIGEDAVFWVDGAGTHQDLAGGHVWVEWWAVTDVVDNATQIVILRDRLPSNQIPKRTFASPADVETFLRYVRTHIGTRSEAR